MSSGLLPSLYGGVCGRASVPNGTTSDLNSVCNIARNQEYTPGFYCGSVALLDPTAPYRAGYFCGGGSTVGTTAHESDGFHMSNVDEVYVDIKANVAILFSRRSLLS
jgi:hypothetical protein